MTQFSFSGLLLSLSFQELDLKHSVQLLRGVQLFATPWTAARRASLFINNSQSLLKLMSIALVMPSNHLILCRPFLLPSVFPSIRVFSSESVLCISGPKYWSFRISPFNEYSGLISFRMDWFDLFAVQETLKSLLQHHSLKASVLWCSAFSIVQGKGTTEQLYGALRTTLKDTDKFKVSGCRQHETLIVSI